MPDLLTVPEAMAVVRISRAKLYDPIRSGALMAISIGRCRRIPRTALTGYIARLLGKSPGVEYATAPRSGLDH
jgi:excisionase family DNA binding protein